MREIYKKICFTLLPVGVTFGPLFMALSDQDVIFHDVLSYAGALLLMLSLSGLYYKIDDIEKARAHKANV
jgi:hypothetical protein